MLTFAVGCVGFFAAPLARTRTSALHVTMVDPDATRDPSPQSFDNDMSGWKPDQGVKDIPEGKALHAGNFESTDTPDFFRDDDYGKDIDVMDGVMGSSLQNAKKPRNNNPGVEGAVSAVVPPSERARSARARASLDHGGGSALASATRCVRVAARCQPGHHGVGGGGLRHVSDRLWLDERHQDDRPRF
eukprot:2635813-Prymnesium_polylepis.2